MRLLRMGSSQETNPLIPEASRVGAVACRLFQEATGEPLELTARSIWPAANLPDIVDGWMTRHKPELVFLVSSGFWYTYDSSMLKLQRKWPFLTPAMRPVTQLSFFDWFAQNRAYRVLRRAALRTIGGVPIFTVDQVAETMELCLRRVLAHEPAAVIMRNGASVAHTSTPSNRAECYRRHAELHTRLEAICERLHVVYRGRGDDPMEGEEPRYHLRDLMHWNELGHIRQGEKDAQTLIDAWQAVRGAAGQPVGRR